MLCSQFESEYNILLMAFIHTPKMSDIFLCINCNSICIVLHFISFHFLFSLHKFIEAYLNGDCFSTILHAPYTKLRNLFRYCFLLLIINWQCKAIGVFMYSKLQQYILFETKRTEVWIHKEILIEIVYDTIVFLNGVQTNTRTHTAVSLFHGTAS